jgi:hypothetical protein
VRWTCWRVGGALARLLYCAPHECERATNVTLSFCRFQPWDRCPHTSESARGLGLERNCLAKQNTGTTCSRLAAVVAPCPTGALTASLHLTHTPVLLPSSPFVSSPQQPSAAPSSGIVTRAESHQKQVSVFHRPPPPTATQSSMHGNRTLIYACRPLHPSTLPRPTAA